MAKLWSADALVRATGGKMTASFDADGVTIDSRTLRRGDFFVALHGIRRDGHAFVADALAHQATGALVSRVPDGVQTDAPLLMVPDTLSALWQLGAFARRRTSAWVVAITGSVGKTTTKEMLRRIFAAAGPTHAAKASYNNQWGVPLTLALLPKNAAYAVVEIGTNHPGEIAPLARLTRPHVALITAIARAHIGLFGRLEAIAKEKASLLAALEPGGTAIVPCDSPYLSCLLASVPSGTRAVTFGADPRADARLIEAQGNAAASTAIASLGGRLVHFHMHAAGRHLVMDALAALAAAWALGLDASEAANALADFSPLEGRGEQRRLRLENGEALLIDESYNASGASVRAALAVLARQSGRRIAVLGDMLELGEEAAAEHANLAASVSESSDLLFACGPMMRLLFERVPRALRGGYAATAEELAPLLARMLAPGDAVLVKGSLGSRMRQVIGALSERERHTGVRRDR